MVDTRREAARPHRHPGQQRRHQHPQAAGDLHAWPSGARCCPSTSTAPSYCSQAVYPHMKKAGGGKIINIGSMMSIFGASFAAPYAASKGGIVQMTKALATAWAKDNIQVNAVLPGWIDTESDRGRHASRSTACTSTSDPHAGRALGHAGRLFRHRRVPRLARHPISSPAPRSRSTAATRSRVDRSGPAKAVAAASRRCCDAGSVVEIRLETHVKGVAFEPLKA